MERRTHIRVGGALGILGVVGLLGAGVLGEAAGPGQPALALEPPASYLPALAGNVLFVASQWVFVFGFVAVLGFLTVLYQELREVGAAARLGLIAGIVSTAAFVTASVLLIGIAVGAAPAYASGGAEAAVVVADALMAARQHAMGVEGVLIGVAVLLFGVAQLGAPTLPRWPGYGGLVGGALEVVGGVGTLIPVLEILRPVGFFITLLWVFTTALTMLASARRRPERA